MLVLHMRSGGKVPIRGERDYLEGLKEEIDRRRPLEGDQVVEFIGAGGMRMSVIAANVREAELLL